jgi:hypothetical protein
MHVSMIDLWFSLLRQNALEELANIPAFLVSINIMI